MVIGTGAGGGPAAARLAEAGLDADDLILMAGGGIPLAYPFSAAPTAFAVTFADGRQRFACCAIDALGIAAMLSASIQIRTHCHHCGRPLELAVDATGPLDAGGVMVWVGRRAERERRVSTGL